jgi:hypothetical protein
MVNSISLCETELWNFQEKTCNNSTQKTSVITNILVSTATSDLEYGRSFFQMKPDRCRLLCPAILRV